MKARVRDVKRNFDNGFSYTIGALGSSMSPFPEDWLLSILKQHAGKTVRVVAFNNVMGENVRQIGEVYHKPSAGGWLANIDASFGIVRRGCTPGQTVKIGDHVYSVPTGGNHVINRWYRDARVAIPWLFTYDTGSTIPVGEPEPLVTYGDTIRVTVAANVRAHSSRVQHFAQGVSHCLIQPIINDLASKRAELMAKSDEKITANISNHTNAIRKLTGYAEQYARGIPVSALHTLVEDVSTTGKHINIDIKCPCAQRGDEQFIKIDNQYGHGIRYEFVNWRFDHVDALACTYNDHRHATELSRDDLREMLIRLTSANEFCEWQCDSLGPSSICTPTATYRCHVQFGERYKKFSEQFSGFRIDHINDDMMSKFVLEGVHYCVAASFHDDLPTDDLRCYDMKKSYANFHESRFYDECRFPSKLTDLYPIDRVMGPGYYRIDALDWSNADTKFSEICKLYGHPFQNANVYALPLLKLLDSFNVAYTVTMGCWAGGVENTFDFRFTDELIENKDYALIVGLWNRLKHEDVTCIQGTKEFAQHLKSTSSNCDAFWFPSGEKNPWGSEDGTIRITYPRRHVWHLSQFSGYINAYEFIKMTDQLMLVDLDRVVQIQKDDFLCEAHQFQLLPYMHDKTPELGGVNAANETKLARKLDWNRGQREMAKWARTIIYSISSKKGQCQYIGYTTMTLEKRKQGHVDAYRSKKQECAVSQVLKFKDWCMDLVEDFPCATRAEAENRENFHIQRADNCVNRAIRQGATLEPCAPKMSAVPHESTLDRKLDWTRGQREMQQEFYPCGADVHRPCYLSGLWQFDGLCANPVFQEITNAFRAHADRFAHIDAALIRPHPVIVLGGAGGTGKTDFILRDRGLQRKCYLAQSHKLARAKSVEYALVFSDECDLDSLTTELQHSNCSRENRLLFARKHNKLEVSVWARAMHDSELIWGIIHRYANVLIVDEVSMMHNETVSFLMDRFKQHKIYLCGDPGFQLAAYSTTGDSGVSKSPFDAVKLKLPTYTFTKIFRVTCPRLMKIREEGRQMLECGKTPLSWDDYRVRHGGTRFPADWGMQQFQKRSPVAGLCFNSVPQWYIDMVTSRCASTHGIMHQFKRFTDREYHEAQPITVEELEEYYKSRFTTVTSFQEVADGYTAWEQTGDDKYVTPRTPPADASSPTQVALANLCDLVKAQSDGNWMKIERTQSHTPKKSAVPQPTPCTPPADASSPAKVALAHLCDLVKTQSDGNWNKIERTQSHTLYESVDTCARFSSFWMSEFKSFSVRADEAYDLICV